MSGEALDALVPLAWIGGAILVLGFVLVRLRHAQRRRPASALPPFLRHFESEGVPVEVAITVFHQLQHWMEAQDHHYPVRHDQDLASVYGTVPEELEVALSRMSRECGRRFDRARPRAPLTTVADLVAELARCPEDPHE